MIEFRANSGKTGDHRAVSFMIGTTFLSFYQTNDGDRWVQMIGDEAMLTARFRLPVPAAGGKSPNTLYAIADIIDSIQEQNVSARLSPYFDKSPLTVSRADEEMGIRLTSSLVDNVLALTLADPFGRQETADASVSAALMLEDCPVPLRAALRNLPAAMAMDDKGIWPK